MKNYTKEILNILKIASNIAFNENSKIILIKPIHLFVAMFLSNNFISNLYFIPNKNILIKLYNYNIKINYYKYKIIFSQSSLNLLKVKNNNIFTTLNLFINILNINNDEINKLLGILGSSIDILKNDFIKLFLKNNNINTYLLKYMINIETKFNDKNFKFIEIINNNKLFKILNNCNLFLIGEKGIGKKSIIYNYVLNNFLNSKTYYLELNIEKLLIEKKNLKEIENYLYKIFNILIKTIENKYYILIPNIHLLFINENSNFNLSINTLFKYFLKFFNLKFIFTSNKRFHSLLTKNEESIFNESIYNLNLIEPNNKILKDILNIYIKNYYKKYKIKLNDILLDKLIGIFNNYNLEEKNPLKILKFLDYLFINKINKHNYNINKVLKYNINIDYFLIQYFKLLYNNYILKWNKRIYNYKKNNIIRLISDNIVTNFINFYNFKNINNIFYKKYLFNINNKLLLNNLTKNNITINDILNDLSIFIKLPKEFLKSKLNFNINIKSKLQDYIKLEKTLKNKIFGQDIAIEQILNSIKKNKLGLKSYNKPIGSYIFAGLSGTGKTELVKALAEGLFGNENYMIRFDMSEFMEKHSLSRLIGSPPGYIGHEEGGQLTNAVLKNPYSIILLDEIEKAHPDITNILLQLLDDGRLTDSKGNLINFSNTIIVLTTNLGSPKNLIEYPFLKNKGKLSKNEFNKFILNTNSAIEKFFRPEFLNRLDSIIVFKPLGLEELKFIMYKFINDFNLKLKQNSFLISFYLNESFIKLILSISYKPLYGARPLKRIIEKIIEKPINELLLFFNINKNILIYFYIDLLTNKPSFSLLKN